MAAAVTALFPTAQSGIVPAIDEGFFYEAAEPSRWNALRYIDEPGGWGLAFHSEAYVRERWGAIFGSVEIVRGRGTQDVVLVEP